MLRFWGATPVNNRAEIGAPLVELKQVSVKYPVGIKRDDIQSLAYRLLLRGEKRTDFWALQEANFTGRSGDIVGIVGANGAGKTTLCKVISGVLRPDTGSIAVLGNVYALLSLGTGFNNTLTGRENVLLNGMMLGLSRSQLNELTPQIEEFSGLGRFMDEPLKTYSSGMRARLGFSIAAMVNPEILIVDETLSVGDAQFSHKAAEKMQDLVRQASLVIVVTHQTDFVEKYCTTAMWLDKGIVRATGQSADVVAKYKASITKPNGTPAAPTKVISLPESKPLATQQEIIRAQNVGLHFSLSKKEPGKFGSGFMKGRMRLNESFQVLEDVSFAVNQGDILGIIGRNGAGKTTLCRILGGILKPDSGSLDVRGETAALLTLGTGFNDQLTGRDNILLNGMMLGIPRRKLESISGEISSFSELGAFLDQPVKQYSRGMRSRLGFSIAAAIQPDIFIVDEALAVGDLSFYAKASAKMQELMSAAKAVIVVTHDMAFVQRVCTRAIWLDGGCVKVDGTTQEAVAAYLKSAKN